MWRLISRQHARQGWQVANLIPRVQKGTIRHYTALHNGSPQLCSLSMENLMWQFFNPPLFFATIAQDCTAQIIAINQAMWRGHPELAGFDAATAKDVETQAPQPPNNAATEFELPGAVKHAAPQNVPLKSAADSKVVVLADAALRRSLKSTATSTAIVKRAPALKRGAKTKAKSAKRRR